MNGNVKEHLLNLKCELILHKEYNDSQFSCTSPYLLYWYLNYL